MAEQPPRSRHTATWIVVGILLAASLVGTLWVPFYARTTPELGSFPFYYWYQLVWIPIVAVLSWLAYLLTKRVERARRASAPGTPLDAADSGAGEVR